VRGSFRAYLPAPDDPRAGVLREEDAYSHAEHCLAIPWLRSIVESWHQLNNAPFFGITSDGRKIPGLYSLASEGAPLAAMVEAARRLLAQASAQQRAALCHPIDAHEWRVWSNPEIYVDRFGLRLDEVEPRVRDAVLEVLRASLSAKGYRKACDVMYMNQFLGELVHAPRVLNQYSYNFNLFGTPSANEPWGWNLYGHHLVFNCFVLADQMVLSPSFRGAEPNQVDDGPHAGLTLFQDEERIGLDLMRSLPAALRDRARIYEQMEDPAMPPGRVHPADGRHLGGAFEDNRVIPYEGVPAREFTGALRKRLLDLMGTYLEYLPAGPFAARMRTVEEHLDETHFCWIGAFDDDSPFYYRIQSPIVIIEFDHHSGIFLSNTHPAKFHIHTLVRTPNGNDYGMELIRLHCERKQLERANAGHAE
jgi:Protein of unknown function (DUF3500)